MLHLESFQGSKYCSKVFNRVKDNRCRNFQKMAQLDICDVLRSISDDKSLALFSTIALAADEVTITKSYNNTLTPDERNRFINSLIEDNDLKQILLSDNNKNNQIPQQQQSLEMITYPRQNISS
jgi:hypothetical protein